MHLRRCITVLTTAAAALAVAGPAEAAWEPEQQVNPDDPAVTEVGAALVGAADDGTAVAVWLEWRGADARVVSARRPVDGDWGPSQLVDDVTEKADVVGGRVGLDSLVVLPNGNAVVGYHEYDVDSGVDFVGRLVTLHPDGSVSQELSGGEAEWQLVADVEGDWLATTREHDHCACENDTFYSDGGAAPERLGTYLGFGLRFALSGREVVYYAVDDPDGLYQRGHTLRVQRVDAATGQERTVTLLRPHGRVIGIDLSASRSNDVDLAWSVRHPGRHRPDVVLATHKPADRTWEEPHAVFTSGNGNNRPVGAPQVGTDGVGKALVVWSTPPDGAGRVDLDAAGKQRYAPWGSTRRLMTDVLPDAPQLAFGLRIADSGRAAVVLRHLAPCSTDPGATCDTVSATVKKRIRNLGEPEAVTESPAPFDWVTMTLAEYRPAIVLTIEGGSTRIITRTRPT